MNQTDQETAAQAADQPSTQAAPQAAQADVPADAVQAATPAAPPTEPEASPSKHDLAPEPLTPEQVARVQKSLAALREHALSAAGMNEAYKSASGRLASIVGACDHAKRSLPQAASPREAAEATLGKIRSLALDVIGKDLPGLVDQTAKFVPLVADCVASQHNASSSVDHLRRLLMEVNDGVNDLAQRVHSLEAQFAPDAAAREPAHLAAEPDAGASENAGPA